MLFEKNLVRRLVTYEKMGGIEYALISLSVTQNNQAKLQKFCISPYNILDINHSSIDEDKSNSKVRDLIAQGIACNDETEGTD